MWAEPRSPDPPARVWRDWALVAVLLPAAVVEGVVRDDIVWRGLSVAVVVALVPMLLVRRTHPFVAVTVAFGTLTIVDVIALAAGVYMEGLGSGVFMLLFPYALLRWGAGREVAIGMSVVFIPVALIAFEPIPVGSESPGCS